GRSVLREEKEENGGAECSWWKETSTIFPSSRNSSSSSLSLTSCISLLKPASDTPRTTLPPTFTSNIAGFVILLELCQSATPQPSIVWASSSSVYGLNTKVPLISLPESRRRDCSHLQPHLRPLPHRPQAEKSTGSGVSDLASILERLLKVKAKRNMMKLPRNGDVQFTHANISWAQRELPPRICILVSTSLLDGILVTTTTTGAKRKMPLDLLGLSLNSY
ncbi:hypothetical protein F2Q70_00019093, partial [Brassica cretica]